MTTPSPGLSACLRVAERLERAADQLGPAWSGHAPIMQACQEFRRSCEQLATNRGLSEMTVAFIGPKNAGKSTIAGLLVASEEKRQRLKAGETSRDATTKPTWISAREPALLDRESEDFIPCHESELVPLGYRYALLDVPGLNEGDSTRRALATRALDHAVVKVLVTDRRSIESGEIARYLDRTAGAPVIPVVNHIRQESDRADLAEWEENLRRTFPTLLPRIEIWDWDIGGDRTGRERDARRALTERLAEAIAGRSPETLAEPQLARKVRDFEDQVAELADRHLPATAVALKSLHDALTTLPAQAVESLLGTERLIVAQVRLRFRAILLERTPIYFFPWRITLAIANLVHGAIDRVPLALMGSIPSMVTAAWAAAKNVRDAHQFAEEATSGLRTRVNAVIKDLAGPQLQAIDYALQRELGEGNSPARTDFTATASLRGLDTLQTRSAELFHSVTEKFAPGAAAAWLLGLLGFAVFWIVFGWPIYALYHDYWLATQEVALGAKDTLHLFPSGAVSMLVTSAMLALIPMALLLLFAVAFFTRRSRARTCANALRASHEAELQRLTDHGQVEVEISEPKIDACRSLLRLGRITPARP